MRVIKRFGFGFALLLLTITAQAQKRSIIHFLCEGQSAPVGIDVVKPAFSWQLNGIQRNIVQTAYRLLVADDSLLLKINKGNIWDSGKMFSSQSIRIIYGGKALEPVKTYYCKVLVWDSKSKMPRSGKIITWQMGLLSSADWYGAKWIGYGQLPDSLHIVPFMPGLGDGRWNNVSDILPLFRKQFNIDKAVKKATVFISGLGQFEMSLNGKKVGDHFLDPGWTKYDTQALYITFDITRQIRQGPNAMGVMLGNGFYFIPGERYRKISGAFGFPKMICRIVVQYLDGSSENIISDSSWKTSAGPVTFSSIYGGEDYNANLEQRGWDRRGFDDENWKTAVVVDGPPELSAQSEQPLKIVEHFNVRKITQPRPGVYVYDMGQNASGIPCVSVKGRKGNKIKIFPSELLGNEGLITQKAIGAPVFFQYTLKGEGTETWQPRFMYYGFRYIQIEGAVPQSKKNPDRLPAITTVRSLHTRNSAARIGYFTCSNELFNKTFKLIDWAIQSNTASVFTDCPHREKLGWLEEAHLVGSSIRYNYDIASLCHKVIRDMIRSQTADGLIPDIAPEYVQFGGGFRDSPEWGSNGIILPWYMYEWYNDKQVLFESYDMMKRYIAYLDKRSNDHILTFGLGDWYDIGPNPPGVSQLTPAGITATAMYYYDLTILSRVAKILGMPEDEIKFNELSEKVRIAFNNRYFNEQTKQYGTGSQTANAVAVYMGLVPPFYRDSVIANIIKDIRARNNSLTAGDIGYRYLLRVLDDAGRSDVIYDMNNRSDVPGYGYQLARGATALTESWQGASNASNDHFMLGHLMEWFYSGLAGIKTADDSVAFKRIIIRPEPVGDISFSKASYQSPYGWIATEWKRKNGNFYLTVTIPANTTAVVYLPEKRFAGADRKKVEIGSGTYHFQTRLSAAAKPKT